MRISSNFDSGSIDVVSVRDPIDIQLRLRKDSHSDHLQWFYFRLTGAQGVAVRMCLTNAQDATFNRWEGYRAFASYDQKQWFRVPTTYERGELIIEHTPAHGSVCYAYFEPYTYGRHFQLVQQSQLSERCRVEVIGQSVEGRDIDLLVVGDERHADTSIWLVARQHPGEAQSEWFMEGLIENILDETDEHSRALLEKAVFYLVPNMNPDGAIRGNQRTNAEGINLNREWDDPSERSSPEVFHVRRKIKETGVFMFFDIHGEEEIPFVFLCGSEGNLSYTARQQRLESEFCERLLAISQDFQTAEGYGKDARGEANMSLASNWVADAFDCLGMTLELPFKDNLQNPVPETGWTAQRSKRFAGEFLMVIEQTVNR